MRNKYKLFLKNLTIYAKQHWLVSTLLISSICMIIVHVLYKIPSVHDFFSPTWSSGEVLSYIGSIISVIVTIYVLQETIESTLDMQKEERIFSLKPSFHIKTYILNNDDKLNRSEYFSIDTNVGNRNWMGEVALLIEVENVGAGNAVSLSVKFAQIGTNNEEITVEHLPPLAVGNKQSYLLNNCALADVSMTLLYSDVAYLAKYQTKTVVNLYGNQSKLFARCLESDTKRVSST